MATISQLTDITPLVDREESHDDYLHRMEHDHHVPSVVMHPARQVWAKLKAALPGLRMPAAGVTEHGMFYVWVLGELRVSMDFELNGESDWFFIDLKSNQCTGADFNADLDLPAPLIDSLRMIACHE
jgi:hypothetical protein